MLLGLFYLSTFISIYTIGNAIIVNLIYVDDNGIEEIKDLIK